MAFFTREAMSSELDYSPRFAVADAMPDFWPPRPSRFWAAMFRPFERLYAYRCWRLSHIEIEGLEEAYQRVGAHDSVLIAPNHSFEGDAFVLRECSRRVGRNFFFMAAWEAFRGHWGFNGWLMQRLGCFSVDREGSDRRAVKTAVGLLTQGQTLVLFPEGEIHHLNEKLTPLMDGAAFIALTAQRKLNEGKPDAPNNRAVWIVPASIRYRFCEDVRPNLEAAMTRLEKRMLWMRPPAGATLRERVLHFGEMVLTLKEKEKLGRSFEQDGDLRTRICNLIEALLARRETAHLGKSPSAETIPLRVKALRRNLLKTYCDSDADPQARQAAGEALEDVQLALQLFSYPGNYIRDDDSIGAIAETIEKFQEDLFGECRSLGKREARIIFGEPIDMRQAAAQKRSREAIANVTAQMEDSISQLLIRGGEPPASPDLNC